MIFNKSACLIVFSFLKYKPDSIMFFSSVFISLKLNKQNIIITNANKVKEPKLIIILKSLEYIVIKKRKRLIKKENKSDTLNILKFINLYMSLIFC